jgi:uncharacterized surface anchored protein
VVSETRAPEGYHLDSAAKTIEVKSHAPTSITFTNRPYSGIQIIKTDSVTHAPLAGATFKVTRVNGEAIGTYRTDAAGMIIVPDLSEGTYIVSETIAPDGYILDETPKNVIVSSGKLAAAEFTNKPLAVLRIIKLDSATRRPIAGAEFQITRMDGGYVENDFRGNIFRTDRTGQIYITELPDRHYIVTETRAADGYILDGEPQTVHVQSGKITVLEVLNTPMSSRSLSFNCVMVSHLLYFYIGDYSHLHGRKYALIGYI